MTTAPLPPGSTIGILGGGQLARMLAMAAARLGLKCHVYNDEETCPAFDVCADRTVAAYADETALARFGKACDAVTVEFENIPAEVLGQLAQWTIVRPAAQSLAICQDRREEKRLVDKLGIPTARWREVSSAEALAGSLAELGGRTLLKTRRLGYDGKGQARLDGFPDADSAWNAIGGTPSILEVLVPFAREISVVGVRGADGAFAAYDPAENRHESGILRRSVVPARITPATAEAALDIARQIGAALDHVGTFAVELFVVGQGTEEELLVNEIAPRVHNTGHWTIEACPASQFEAHVRAVAGWPLPATTRLADAEMTNLIGDESSAWSEIAGEAGAALHLYGKAESRPGRKMGHVTRLRSRGDPREGI